MRGQLIFITAFFDVGSRVCNVSWGDSLSHLLGIMYFSMLVLYYSSPLYSVSNLLCYLFFLINPVIDALSLLPQNLADPVHPSTKVHMFNFDP